MALSSSVLSAAMRAAMLANPAIGAVDGAPLTAMCNAIASTVVAHITSAAVVLPTALIAPGGLTPLPVTGVGTIT